MDGTSKLATAQLSGGSAAISLKSLSTGTHRLTAVYGGDATHGGSTSPVLAQSVTAAASRTALTVSPRSVWIGQTVTLRASVTSAAGRTRGTVTFSDGTHVLGSARLRDGRAVLTTSFHETGEHAISASYAGGGDVAASTSAVVTVAVHGQGECGRPGTWNGWWYCPAATRTSAR
jgi:hypothetical protein